MEVIKEKPIPIYESTCPECKSVCRYKANEVHMGFVTCPVCGISMWGQTISPVNFKEINAANSDEEDNDGNAQNEA